MLQGVTLRNYVFTRVKSAPGFTQMGHEHVPPRNRGRAAGQVRERAGGRLKTRIHVSNEPEAAPADIQAVQAGLREFNIAHIGPSNSRLLQLFLRDDSGEIVGGLLGEIRWHWLYVATLWISTDLRGHGYGSDLLSTAESEARSAGCIGIYLDTFEYQARPFYEKHGYELFGALEGYPPGYSQYHLAKQLV